jgi:hypothetical protein
MRSFDPGGSRFAAAPYIAEIAESLARHTLNTGDGLAEAAPGGV